jgi:putative endonuclease
MERLVQAGAAYMHQIGHEWEIRFDVISVLVPPGQAPVIRHLPDAFFPGV